MMLLGNGLFIITDNSNYFVSSSKNEITTGAKPFFWFKVFDSK